MPELLFAGIVKQGKVMPDDAGRVAGYMAKEEGQRVQVRVKRPPKIRSIASNAYLWSVVYPTIGEASGNDTDSVHEGMKALAAEKGMLIPRVIQLGARTVEVLTTKVEQEAFGSYVNWIRHEAEHGWILGTKDHPVPLHIPEPNEGF